MPDVLVTARKLTKIVCTVGPACDNVQTLCHMVHAGMNVARLNFSHGSFEDHHKTLERIRQAEVITGIPTAILQDLCGPKLRVVAIPETEHALFTEDFLWIDKGTGPKEPGHIGISQPSLIDDVQVGERIFLDDGLIQLMVEEKQAESLKCRIKTDGKLRFKQGINLPDTTLSLPSLTQKDWNDVGWGIEHEVDYFALSFVRSANDVQELRQHLLAKRFNAGLIAKIEKREAVENIDTILDVSDGIMIARGDMGVELDATRVPWIQKQLVQKAAEKGKPVITATQMLETMTYNKRPTRAEVADVTTSVLEGTDCVMLSGETAMGIDPLGVVQMMTRIIQTAEKELVKQVRRKIYQSDQYKREARDACIDGASLANAKATFVIDNLGEESLAISRKDKSKITVAIIDEFRIGRKVALYHSTVAVRVRCLYPLEDALSEGIQCALRLGFIVPDDTIAYIEGQLKDHHGFLQLAALRLLKVSENKSTL